eukprot:GHVU01098741.1.p1 GENE.GHVU01098741.1~~GHVU01098741.1.p1  ORF type:complete len:553 (+),score=41.66 GHVU01098741.1:177-1661(+)
MRTAFTQCSSEDQEFIQRYQTLIFNNLSSFRLRLLSTDPAANVPPMQVRLRPNARPVRTRPRRYGRTLDEVVDTWAGCLEETNWHYRNDNATWSSPPVVVARAPSQPPTLPNSTTNIISSINELFDEPEINHLSSLCLVHKTSPKKDRTETHGAKGAKQGVRSGTFRKEFLLSFNYLDDKITIRIIMKNSGELEGPSAPRRAGWIRITGTILYLAAVLCCFTTELRTLVPDALLSRVATSFFRSGRTMTWLQMARDLEDHINDQELSIEVPTAIYNQCIERMLAGDDHPEPGCIPRETRTPSCAPLTQLSTAMAPPRGREIVVRSLPLTPHSLSALAGNNFLHGITVSEFNEMNLDPDFENLHSQEGGAANFIPAPLAVPVDTTAARGAQRNEETEGRSVSASPITTAGESADPFPPNPYQRGRDESMLGGHLLLYPHLRHAQRQANAHDWCPTVAKRPGSLNVVGSIRSTPHPRLHRGWSDSIGIRSQRGAQY